MTDPSTTKDRILAAAEHLFAEKGLSGASLREITAAAEVNLASVHYHFGSKDGLVRELVMRRFAPINQARLEGLDRLEARHGPEPVPLEELLRVFLEPALRIFGGPGADFPRLIGRLHLEPHPDLPIWMQEIFQPVLVRFGAAMTRTLPHLDRGELLLRISFLVGSMIHVLTCARQHHALFPGCSTVERDPELLMEQLIRYSAAGFAHA